MAEVGRADAAVATTAAASSSSSDVEETTTDEEETATDTEETGPTTRAVELNVATGAFEAELTSISDRVRQAMECPVCLLTPTSVSCYCPNGHAMCDSCLNRLWDTSEEQKCPMCRSPLTEHPSPTTGKLVEIAAAIRVACAYRTHGCLKLMNVLDGVRHETYHCAHVPDVRCLIPRCHWIGVYDRLFEHAQRAHPAFVVCTTEDRLKVDDVDSPTSKRHLAYLVKTEQYGLLWVVIFRETRRRLRCGLFVVWDKRRAAGSRLPPSQGPPNLPDEPPPGISFRLMTNDQQGALRVRGRPRIAAWDLFLENNYNGRCALATAPPESAFITVRIRSSSVTLAWSRNRSKSRASLVLPTSGLVN